MAKEVTDMEFSEDLASTTAYIYSEIMESPLFFSNIDKAIELAKAFIKEFPTNTDWEQMPTTWEETLYNFYVAHYGSRN